MRVSRQIERSASATQTSELDETLWVKPYLIEAIDEDDDFEDDDDLEDDDDEDDDFGDDEDEDFDDDEDDDFDDEDFDDDEE